MEKQKLQKKGNVVLHSLIQFFLKINYWTYRIYTFTYVSPTKLMIDFNK
jgi:hypothetical protein